MGQCSIRVTMSAARGDVLVTDAAYLDFDCAAAERQEVPHDDSNDAMKAQSAYEQRSAVKLSGETVTHSGYPVLKNSSATGAIIPTSAPLKTAFANI